MPIGRNQIVRPEPLPSDPSRFRRFAPCGEARLRPDPSEGFLTLTSLELIPDPKDRSGL
jgi:hypothetical protein